MTKRVMVAMSGGVDSSVAALLCVEKGYEVIGATMQIWPDAESEVMQQEGGCCSSSAVTDARQVCAKLGIPHYVLNLKQCFERHVVADFCREYARGRTPNPCIVCNRVIKWEQFMIRALRVGAQYIATGHYARIERAEDGTWLLKRAAHLDRDQSYALYSLTQEQISHTLFPVGDLAKSQVRDVAERAGLLVARKQESQDICFVQGGDYRKFLSSRCPEAFRPGVVVDTSGRVLAEHSGVANFTVGQRRGLGLNAGKPMYVVQIDPEKNRVVVGTYDECFSRALVATECNWIVPQPECVTLDADVKVRYRSQPARARVVRQGPSAEVYFAKPERAVAPGQSAVFYEGDIVLGGGVIDRRLA